MMTQDKKIIAEIGSVHDGSFGNALKLVEAVALCGADTVKFQTHIAQAETLENAPNPSYFSQESRYDYFNRTAFSIEQWKQIAQHSNKHNIQFISSPFSLEAVALLEEVGVSAYKIPSGEVSNLPLLELIADTGKPVYISSGMSDWSELDSALNVLQPLKQLTIMQCSSVYPCPIDKVGLNVIQEMQDRYGLPVGFSDHTAGQSAAIAAAALGAVAIEKHFTFSKLMYGSDAINSMEPPDFKQLCSNIKEVWSMLQNPVDKNSIDQYRSMKDVFEKSLVTAVPIACGEILTKDNLSFKKPGNGIPARKYRDYIGRKVKNNLPKDYQITESDLM